jgi:K+-transporting ATPase KdpF subunit
MVGGIMSILGGVALVVAAAVLAYLVLSLVRPEKF